VAKFYTRQGKRILDLIIALPTIAILVLPLILLSSLVRINLGKPIFFRQIRPGRYGKLFTLIKFRTMTNERDNRGNLLSDEVRLTSFGVFLRSFSLDELPELINVIKGNMSLVGPRPLLTQYLGRYNDEQSRRHEVSPGITGWAQINGRNALTWEEKFKLDVWYVDNQSLWLDLKIIAKTILKIFAREGITQNGHATAEEFKGNHHTS
jgi:sugar transferase EpsL